MLICLHCNVDGYRAGGDKEKAETEKNGQKTWFAIFMSNLCDSMQNTISALQHSHLEQMKFYDSAKSRNRRVVVVVIVVRLYSHIRHANDAK